jgi:hypothetical protein
MDTPVPESTNGVKFGGIFANLEHCIIIVRCRSCGKEAPYMATDIICFTETANAAHLGT